MFIEADVVGYMAQTRLLAIDGVIMACYISRHIGSFERTWPVTDLRRLELSHPILGCVGSTCTSRMHSLQESLLVRFRHQV